MNSLDNNDKDILIKKFGNDINFLITDEFIEINLYNIKSKIMKPSNSFQYYSVIPCNNDYIWYDKINMFCMQENPSEKKIISKLIKQIEKEFSKTNQMTENNKKNEIENIDENLEYYSLKSKLTQLIKNSTNGYNLDVDQNVKKLYDENIIKRLLVDEFLSIWKWSKQSNNISVELVNDNMYIWKVKIFNFKNNELMNDLLNLKNNSEKCVEVEISFHEKFYPNYPPMVRIINPNLQNKLSHRISNSKMTQLAYWTPTRSVQFIISRIIEILNKFGKIEVTDNTLKKGKSKFVLNIISNITKLSSLIDSVSNDDEIDSDYQFIKFDLLTLNSNKNNKNNKNSAPTFNKKEVPTYWKPGTGYGTTNSSSWDPEEYYKLQKEKDKNISGILTNMINTLQQINSNSEDFKEICNIISESLLLTYLKQQLKENTLLEMQNREHLFKLMLSLIEIISTENSMYLFDIKFNNLSLFDTILELNSQLQTVLKIDKENEFTQLMHGTFEAIVIPMFGQYKLELSNNKNNEKHEAVKNNPTTKNLTGLTPNELYKEKLTPLRFEYVDILGNNFNNDSIVPNSSFKESYVQAFKKDIVEGNWRKCQKRLSAELPSLMPIGQLPIDFDASIFLRVDENNPMIIKALITGPNDTPYENGCYIFDLYVSPKYPENFTNCWFMNTGGKRLNPNLYDSGKVCLSILGTWSGSKSESWNEKTSSLLQVLISIQSQILIEEPEFNEPGHERNIGTRQGLEISKAYNANIRYYSMCCAIRDLIKNPKLYPHFENVVREHFKIKKERVLKTCKKWVDEAPTQLKQKYIDVYNEISQEIEKL